MSHINFYKIYDRIVVFFFIRKFTKKFQTYIIHCSQCQLNRIVKYLFYESSRFIQSSTIFFHTMTINFILVFSIIATKLNIIFIVTCKFIKKILLIFEKNTYSTKQWANFFFMTILKYDWNVSRAIISNKNNKFMSIFWINVFRRFDINLFVFTIYHSQWNDQFKRTN